MGSLFRLTRPELVDMLTAAETVLRATGNAVVLCPSYGVDSYAMGASYRDRCRSRCSTRISSRRSLTRS